MDNLVNALKRIPEVRLRLIDLAWQVARDDGSIDMDRLLLNVKETDEAIDEARAYAETTGKASRCLMRLVLSWN